MVKFLFLLISLFASTSFGAYSPTLDQGAAGASPWLFSLPSGAATSANQTTELTYLSRIPVAGPAAISASQPVVFASDLSVNGGTALSAVNTDLMTGTVNGWFDAQNFHSVSIQVIASAGIAAGQFIFEQTNDTTAASAGVTWPVYDAVLVNNDPYLVALSAVAGTVKVFEAPVTARYVRCRISTAVSGGTVQATSIFSQLPYASTRMRVQNATGTNLQVNATVSGSLTSAGTVSSVASSQAAIPGIIADVASAALTTTTTTATLTPTFGATYKVSIPVTVVSGTTPTLDIQIQESADTGTNWYAVYDFPRITATGFYHSPTIPLTGNRIRYVQTVGGTTPSFTRAINRLQSSWVSADRIRQQIDRTIVLTTANSTTPSLFVAGTSNVDLVVNLGAATTAPVLQIEGSEDNVNWYSIGGTLTTIASSTVKISAVAQATYVRARVSTAGATVTPGYVLLKAY